MNKMMLIWVVIVVVVVLAAVAWGMKKGGVSYDSRSWMEYGTAPADEAMVGPEQGVDDIAAEADSSATLDGSVDSDLQQLEKELQGI